MDTASYSKSVAVIQRVTDVATIDIPEHIPASHPVVSAANQISLMSWRTLALELFLAAVAAACRETSVRAAH